SKIKQSYNDYAQPHASKAYNTIYNENVQQMIVYYQQQAQARIDNMKKLSQEAKLEAQRIHSTHVNPMIEKVTFPFRSAWERVSFNLQILYLKLRVMYYQHVYPRTLSLKYSVSNGSNWVV